MPLLPPTNGRLVATQDCGAVQTPMRVLTPKVSRSWRYVSVCLLPRKGALPL